MALNGNNILKLGGISFWYFILFQDVCRTYAIEQYSNSVMQKIQQLLYCSIDHFYTFERIYIFVWIGTCWF